MADFLVTITEVEDFQETQPDLVGVVGRFQVTAENHRKETCIFHTGIVRKPGDQLWVHDPGAEWNGTYWELPNTF